MPKFPPCKSFTETEEEYKKRIRSWKTMWLSIYSGGIIFAILATVWFVLTYGSWSII